MAKENEEKLAEQVDNMELNEEQLKSMRDQLRKDLREKFDKWIEVFDEDSTDADIEAAKKEFDDEISVYQNKQYVIAEKDALAYAELLKDWNANGNSWEKGEWRGVIMFDNVISGIIEKLKANPELPLEIDYSTLVYLHKTMSNPQGYGIEAAKRMAKWENYDPIKADSVKEEYYITYSHILSNILDIVRELTALDKKMKLMRERINILTAGVKFNWKISEVEEFIELHEAWVGTAVPDDPSKL